MFLVELVGSVYRREKVIVFIMCALWAFFVIPGIADKFHIVVLETDTGVKVETAPRQVYADIPGTQQIVAVVVVAHFHLFEQIEFVGPVICIGKQFGGEVHVAEPFG